MFHTYEIEEYFKSQQVVIWNISAWFRDTVQALCERANRSVDWTRPWSDFYSERYYDRD